MDRKQKYANIPEAVRSGIEKYVERIRQEISVDKAILFVSYASGTFANGSDIDSAIFSNYFQGMRGVGYREGLKQVNEEYNHNYIVRKEAADAYKTKKEYHKLYGSLH